MAAYNGNPVGADEFVNIGQRALVNLEPVVAPMHSRDLSSTSDALEAPTRDVIQVYEGSCRLPLSW